MLTDFDIAMSASVAALLASIGQFAQATVAFGLSLFLFASEED